jgi:hypothetical protein
VVEDGVVLRHVLVDVVGGQEEELHDTLTSMASVVR